MAEMLVQASLVSARGRYVSRTWDLANANMEASTASTLSYYLAKSYS